MIDTIDARCDLDWYKDSLSAAHQRIGAMRAEAENLRRRLERAEAEIVELRNELEQTGRK